MSTYITVKKRLPKGPEHEMQINGIFESEEQAKRALGDEHTQEPVYEWSGPHQPKFDEFVDIHNGTVHPITRPKLFDAIENALRREEISHLYQMNESLQTYVSALELRLQEKPKAYDRDRGRTPVERRVKDLWVCDNLATVKKDIVADYVRSEQPSLVRKAILAADQTTANELNRQVQQNRLSDGSFDGSRGMAHNRILLHTGDRIQFFKANEEMGVSDMDLGDVVALLPNWRSIAVSLDRNKGDVSSTMLVNLKEFDAIDLGYATTFARGDRMDLNHAFVLADHRTPTRPLVELMTSFHVEVYADYRTAAEQFPDYLKSFRISEEIDFEADPLGLYSPRS